MATIAKLDSNGVQVLPEGRTKTTSPQVHSSTDLSNTQEGNFNNYFYASTDLAIQSLKVIPTFPINHILYDENTFPEVYFNRFKRREK